ncbi:MAG: diguanylate cyclase, partial [Hyphomicrobiaceae bacterium]
MKQTLRRLPHFASQPMIGFSVIVIALSWAAASIKTETDIAARRQEAIVEVRGYAGLLEQDVIRAVEEVDRTLKYVRRSYERSGYKVDWAQLLNEDFTVNARTVQMAAIDASGNMISSTAQLYPQKPIDLSDREHFKYHVGEKPDRLFISLPVIGRASGKSSVQFTRRLANSDGSFDGVIVASIAPDAMVAAFAKINDLAKGGVAVIGDDGFVRAAAGIGAELQGKPYRSGKHVAVLTTRSDGSQVTEVDIDSQRRFMTTKSLHPFPLRVVTSMAADNSRGPLNGLSYYIVAALFSASTIIIGYGAYRRQKQHVHQIAALAHTDVLTGLHNRLQLQIELDHAANEVPSGLIIHLIDLDHFKDVNDTYGHPIGDKLLKAAAERIRSSVRDADLIFRLGG